MKGKLIIFEGINGSGKSFYVKQITDNFLPNTIYLKFPNRTTKTGKLINKFLKKEIEIPNKKIIQLFIDNILENNQLIINKLYQGINVICDRYIISTLTYHYSNMIKECFENDISNKDTISALLKLIQYKFLPKPDIVFLINGNHFDKRNINESDLQRYHKDELMNIIVFNNYITFLTLLNDNWEIIDNTNLNKTKENLDIIITKILLLKTNIIQYY